MFTIRASACTDVGKRSNNEDAFLCLPQAGVFALADGMGGPPAGEVASAIFAAAVGEVFGAAIATSLDSRRSLLQEAYRLAHRRMKEHVGKYPDHEGMGCTADLLVVTAGGYLLGHLGDSRVYLFRDGTLEQLTRDHSLVQQLVEQGLVSPAQAQRHPMKNVLLRVLGADAEPSYDLSRGAVFPGDVFLLCSDGLTERLDQAAIREALSGAGTLEQKTVALIEGAKAAGGTDNVTVLLCQPETDPGN